MLIFNDRHAWFKEGLCPQEAVKEAVEQITHWADRFDCMVIGPGLGRDELVHDTVKQVGCLFFGLSSIGRNRSGKQQHPAFSKAPPLLPYKVRLL